MPYIENAVTDAEKEFAVWQREELRKTFNQSISEFYEAYSPTDYQRQGHGSGSEGSGGLYDLFELSNVNDTGAKMYFEDDYSDIYSEANMHSGRKGYDGLFQLVFVEGYHGGARGISGNKWKVWGKHPSPGTPYWRRMAFVRAIGAYHRYGAWGYPAFKSTPPKELVQKNMSALHPEMDARYDETWDRKIDEHVEKYINEQAYPIVISYILNG